MDYFLSRPELRYEAVKSYQADRRSVAATDARARGPGSRLVTTPPVGVVGITGA